MTETNTMSAPETARSAVNLNIPILCALLASGVLMRRFLGSVLWVAAAALLCWTVWSLLRTSPKAKSGKHDDAAEATKQKINEAASDPNMDEELFTHLGPSWERAGQAGSIRSYLRQYGEGCSLGECVAHILVEEACEREKTLNYQSAAELYRVALAHETRDPAVRYFRLNNLGFCLNYMRHFAQAEQHIRLAIKEEPGRYNAWKNLGVSLEHQCQFEQAAECYLKAAQLSAGEHRSVAHFKRLIERCPSLKKIPHLDDLAQSLGIDFL